MFLAKVTQDFNIVHSSGQHLLFGCGEQLLPGAEGRKEDLVTKKSKRIEIFALPNYSCNIMEIGKEDNIHLIILLFVA